MANYQLECNLGYSVKNIYVSYFRSANIAQQNKTTIAVVEIV